MKLSTGKVAFPIEFDNGDRQNIYFNPNDRGIQERIKGFEDAIDKRVKEIDLEKYKSRLTGNAVSIDIEDIDSLINMSPEDLQDLHNRVGAANEIEEEYNKAVREELDVVFGSKISDVVFKYCQPFDTVIVEDKDGGEKRELYILHFLNWLMVELKKYGVENKSSVDKHLSKYIKK